MASGRVCIERLHPGAKCSSSAGRAPAALAAGALAIPGGRRILADPGDRQLPLLCTRSPNLGSELTSLA